MLTIAAYSLDLPSYACAQLRLLGPAAALRRRVELRWAATSDGRDYAIDAAAMDGADVVVFQRYFPMEATWPLVVRALGSGKPVIYEMDDNFLAVPLDHPMRQRLEPVEPFARELLARASVVTVSSPELGKAFAGLARRVEVLPNFLDERLWGSMSARRPAPVRIVFAGTPSHAPDLEIVTPALTRIKERFGNGVELFFMGCAPKSLEATVLPFSEDYAAYARALSSLAPDIGIAPLGDTAFNRCKSAVKWLEYSALGAAGVYADLPPYSVVRPGISGLKAAGDERAWEEALVRLIEDASFRNEMGQRARSEVLGRWGLKNGAEHFFKAWKRAADADS